MAQPIETCVSTSRVDAESWQDLAKSMLASARWRDEDMVFVYTESLDDCRLERCEAANALTRVTACAHSDASLFEGRIFDSAVEARWRRLTDANWTAWIVRELQKAPEAADPSAPSFARARRSTCRYYLVGAGGKAPNHFHEARYAKRFDYPVTAARPNDRAYIEVAQYRRVEPKWSDYSGEQAVDCINDELTSPLLFAHRFVSVGVGSDQEVS